MAIEIVSVPTKNGDVPYLCYFTRGYFKTSYFGVASFQANTTRGTRQSETDSVHELRDTRDPISLPRNNLDICMLADITCVICKKETWQWKIPIDYWRGGHPWFMPSIDCHPKTSGKTLATGDCVIPGLIGTAKYTFKLNMMANIPWSIRFQPSLLCCRISQPSTLFPFLLTQYDSIDIWLYSIW